MTSRDFNSQAASKNFAFTVICLFTLVLLATLELDSQQLQKGVSVELAPTTSAKPIPDADQPNAWIVAVSAEGRLWFGADAVTRDSLADRMTSTPRNREQTLYIKADARAPYAAVLQVLKAAQAVELESLILLTGQRADAQPNGLTPPMGLQVWIESGALAGPKPVEVDITSKERSPMVNVNNREVPSADLPSTLKQLSRGQMESVVRLNADSDVPFGQIARAVDAARAAGAKVVLAIPTV